MFEIKVVVYGDDYTQQDIGKMFPVIPSLKQDYRYLPYHKAKQHFSSLKKGYQAFLSLGGDDNMRCNDLPDEANDRRLTQRDYCYLSTINQYWPISALAVEQAMQSCKKKPIPGQRI